MKLRFRLPDEDEEEREDHVVPEEASEGPGLEGLVLEALALAAAATSAQVFWPLPWLYVLIYGAIGLGVGLAAVLHVGKVGAMAGVVLYVLLDFLTPTSASVSFVLRTLCVMLAVLLLTLVVGALVQRRHARRAEK